MGDILISTSLFAFALTLGAYEFGLWLQKKVRNPLCNPLLVSILVVMGVLTVFKIPAADYRAHCGIFSWILTPATVCLAVPLYEQVKVLKNNIPAIVAGVAGGSIANLVCIALLSRLFSLDSVMLASLLPKSITTALGIAICGQLGGITAVTTASITITGILGYICGSGLCKLLHITSPIAQGVAFGTGSHMLGTGRANEISQLTGAVSSLSLVVAGILTAIVCPGWFSLFA